VEPDPPISVETSAIMWCLRCESANKTSNNLLCYRTCEPKWLRSKVAFAIRELQKEVRQTIGAQAGDTKDVRVAEATPTLIPVTFLALRGCLPQQTTDEATT